MESLTAFIASVRPILEFLYFISSIVLVVVAYKGLQQINVLKKTTSIQSKRDALRLTSEQCTEYCDKIIPLQNNLSSAIKKNNVKWFEGWIIDITDTSVSVKREKKVDSANFDLVGGELTAVLNRMEPFASYFISNVADEKVAYNTVGRTYIDSCKRILPWIVFCRDKGYYKNIMQLFLNWESRERAEDLTQEKISIEEKLATTRMTYHSPVGTD